MNERKKGVIDFASKPLSRRGFLREGAALTTTLASGSLLGGAAFPGGALAATTVNIEIDAGQNENPFHWQADAIKQQFGVDLKLIGLPFVGQYEKLVSELTARSSAYDLLVFPPYFLGDFVALGFLRQLDDYTKLIDPQLADYLPVYRDPVIKRDGKLYALMYDGDMLQVTYRTDLFGDPQEQKNFKAKYGWDLAPQRTGTSSCKSPNFSPGRRIFMARPSTPSAASATPGSSTSSPASAATGSPTT